MPGEPGIVPAAYCTIFNLNCRIRDYSENRFVLDLGTIAFETEKNCNLFLNHAHNEFI